MINLDLVKTLTPWALGASNRKLSKAVSNVELDTSRSTKPKRAA